MTIHMTSSACAVAECERIIEWVDTDATGFIHNSVANRLFEIGEAHYLRPRGLEHLVQVTPRVRMLFNFKSRLAFGDKVVIEVWIKEIVKTSLVWQMKVRKVDGTEAIEGEVTVVHVQSDGPSPWTESQRRALFSAVGEDS